MINIDTSLMPRVLKMRADSDWSSVGDFEKFEQILDTAIANDEPFILVYFCGEPARESNFPPISSLLHIVAKLIMLKSKIEKGIAFNVVCVEDPADMENVETVLKYYTPANETHIAKSKEEVVRLIQSRD